MSTHAGNSGVLYNVDVTLAKDKTMKRPFRCNEIFKISSDVDDSGGRSNFAFIPEKVQGKKRSFKHNEIFQNIRCCW
jgi:predicted nucleic acid binding AN1-type Zn finger protein